jgi:putative heme-binding domain-containing protein
VTKVIRTIDRDTPGELARGLIAALAKSGAPSLASALIERWEELPAAAGAATIEVCSRRVAWANALLDALERGVIARTSVSAAQWLELTHHADASIARRAQALRTTATSEARAQIVARLLGAAGRTGDAERGAQVFESNCLPCHELNGRGGKIGPMLTGVGKRPKAEVLTDVLDPNRSIEATYQLWTASTRDGEFFSGRLRSETRTTVELVELSGERHVLVRAALASLTPSNVSTMPEGFEALGEEDLANLLEFLATRKDP